MAGTRFFDLDPRRTGDDNDAPHLDQATLDTKPEPRPGTNASEHRLALLIGNARYAGAPLRNPVRDVRRLGYILDQLGFAVTTLENADKAQIEQALLAFAERLAQAGPDTVALIHFAGHGIQHGHALYLLPCGSAPRSPGDLALATIAIDTVLASLAETRLKGLVFVVDACRRRQDEAFSADNSEAPLAALSNLTLPAGGTLVVYSTALGSAADDGRGDSSPYAGALAERLPELLEPGHRIHEVFVDAADAVRAGTGGTQSPALFLQGTLPPLGLGPEDVRRRERGIRLLPPIVPWWRYAAVGVATMLVLVAAIGVWLWETNYPETRTAFLARFGLASVPVIDTTCAPPWDKRDRFELTRADWCNLMPREIAAKPAVSRVWNKVVVPAIATGNAKALMLQAARIMKDAPKDAATQPGVATLVRRAAAQGLPMAEGALGMLRAAARTENHGQALASPITSQEADDGYRVARRQGYLPTVIDAATNVIRLGQGDAALALLQPVAARDPEGTANLMMADLYGGRWQVRGVVPDKSKALTYLRRAVRQGNVTAMRRLLQLDRDNQTRLSGHEVNDLVNRIASADPADGNYWRGLELVRRGAADAIDRGIALLKRAAAAGNNDATIALADIAERGIPDVHGHPTRRPDPTRAMHLLKTAAEHGNAWARLEMAHIYRRGDLGAPDRARAAAILRRVIADKPDPGVVAIAERQLKAVRKAMQLEADAPPWDVAVGSAAAPVAMVVYLPLGPSIASSYYRNDVRQIVRELVNPGFVHLRIRLAWGWAASDDGTIRAAHPSTAAAARMLACVPAPQRASLLDRLADSTSGWAGLSADALAAVVHAADPASNPAHVQTCLATHWTLAAVNAAWRDHNSRIHAQQLPFVIVNGQLPYNTSLASLIPLVAAFQPPRLWAKLPGVAQAAPWRGPAERIAASATLRRPLPAPPHAK